MQLHRYTQSSLKECEKYGKKEKGKKLLELVLTCFIMIVDEGKAERFPFAPAAKSKAASPQALPIQSVKVGGLT